MSTYRICLDCPRPLTIFFTRIAMTSGIGTRADVSWSDESEVLYVYRYYRFESWGRLIIAFTKPIPGGALRWALTASSVFLLRFSREIRNVMMTFNSGGVTDTRRRPHKTDWSREVGNCCKNVFNVFNPNAFRHVSLTIPPAVGP